MPWHHIPPEMPPPDNDPRNLDVVCSTLDSFKYRFFVVGDFDADGNTELVVAPHALGSRGNDLWVMKFNVAAGSWQHMAQIPNQPMQADIDCSGTQFPAKFAARPISMATVPMSWPSCRTRQEAAVTIFG
jgi:hypothetical protein